MSDAHVVAIGGGHGLAITLQAARRYAADITAIVSVADDGGSTGRLRRDLGVLGVGDLRKCLVALAADDGTDHEADWARAFEHRFGAGELDGHALGNLVLVGLADVTGDWESALADRRATRRRGRPGAAGHLRAGRPQGRRSTVGWWRARSRSRTHPTGSATWSSSRPTRRRRRPSPDAIAACGPDPARPRIALHQPPADA